MHFMFVARAIVGVSGGVERMITNIMNELVARGHQVSLLTWDTDAEGTSFYPMDERIVWRKLVMGNPNRKAGVSERFARMKAIRSIVRGLGPDVIVGFQDGPSIAMVAYTLGMRIPIVAAERNAPSRFHHTASGNRRFLTYAAFTLCTKIVVQLESYKNQYPSFLRSRIETISNPVMAQEIQAMPGEPHADGTYTLLSVGRLSYQKNYPVLIRAFALLAKRFPKWRLKIVGEGEDREKLETLIAETNLDTARVLLPGEDKNIMPHYQSANLFCLPSLWEGFPNALAEAQACGLPSVGFGQCAGVNELIVHGKNGLHAKEGWTPESLSEALAALMQEDQLRVDIGKQAHEDVQQYTSKEIYSLWEKVLSQAASR